MDISGSQKKYECEGYSLLLRLPTQYHYLTLKPELTQLLDHSLPLDKFLLLLQNRLYWRQKKTSLYERGHKSIQLSSPSPFFLKIHSSTRRLFSVAQCSIKNIDSILSWAYSIISINLNTK